MQQIVSRAKYARIAGISRAMVTKLSKGPLAAACSREGVDLAHPDAVADLAKRGIARPERDPEPETGNLDDLLDLTVREITDRYGSARGFEDWVNLRRKIAATRKLEIQNEEKAGALLHKDFVRNHLFSALETLSRRLLTDTPKTITRKVYSFARSGTPLEEAERETRGLISGQLELAKDSIVKSLKSTPTGPTTH